MELISNLFQFAVTLLGFCMSGIRYLKGRKQTYFLLTCFYGCFALGSLYWTLYLLLFSETPQVFYVSEFGWVASVIFLYLLQYTLSSAGERRFLTGKALIAPLIGIPLCVFYCTFGDVLSNLLWCGMMIVVSYHSRGVYWLALHYPHCPHKGQEQQGTQNGQTADCAPLLAAVVFMHSLFYQFDTLFCIVHAFQPPSTKTILKVLSLI